MSYSSEVLADSPLVWLRLGESSGSTAFDSSGNGRNGTHTGATLGQTSLLASTTDTAAAYTSGRTAVAHAAWMDTAAWSVEAWFKPSAIGGSQTIVSRYFPPGASMTFHLRMNSGAIVCYGYNTGLVTCAAGVTATVGSTYHVVTTYDGSNLRIYVNGVLKGTTAATGLKTTTEPLSLAASNNFSGGTAESFAGTLDEVALYGTALSGTRVAAHYAAGTSTFTGDTGTGTATAPVPTADGAGTVTTTATGEAAAPAPSASGTGEGETSVGTGDASAPAPSASGAGTVTTTGSGDATAPAPTADGTGTVESDTTTGTGDATAPTPGAEGGAVVDGEQAILCVDFVDVEDTPTIVLAAAPTIAQAQPVIRTSYQMPAYDAAHPDYQAYEDYPVVTDVVGHVHLWIDHQDVTYWRGAPTVIREWYSEAPFGDKTARFEFPQLNPWDIPGEGDASFLRADAPVRIAMVDPDGGIRTLWSGFLMSRSRDHSEHEAFTWEAAGTLWAAMHQIHEPVPYLPPTDIGHLLADELNACISRRFHVRRRRTGILTRNRGARDQWKWQRAQDLLSEAWTDDGRQWTLVEVAPGEYDLQLKKPMTEVDATVAYGTPNVAVDVTIDESTRVDGVFCRGRAPGGGGWANVFYPALELLNPPPYPNASPTQYLLLGTTDADTDSGTGVTDWQTRVRELGFTRLRVTGVMSSAWVDVVWYLQDRLDITADGQIGPQTWNATFQQADPSIDLTPVRLPLAVKPWVLPHTYSAAGVITGPNPNYDPTRIPRFVPLDLGVNITKAQGRRIAKTYLAVHGEAVATGVVTMVSDPNNTDRTRLTHGDNLEVTGLEGGTRVMQLASKRVTLDDGRRQYVAQFTIDERARDALTVEQLLERNRNSLPDLSRRPGDPNRQSRNVTDEGFSWDAESPCGVLPKTAVNGSAGLWSIVTIPFAEVGQLSGLRLHGTRPFAVMLFASLAITENKVRSTVANPFASTDPYRPVWNELADEYGLFAAWGAQNDGCGYSPKMESDDAPFTGDFFEGATLEYVTETPPYVAVALYMEGGSGFVWGEFEPAEQT